MASVVAEPPAMDVPGTIESLARYGKRGLRTALFGSVAVLLALILIGLITGGDEDEPAMAILMFPVIWGAMALAMGLWVQVRALRLRRILSRNPWQPRRCRFRIGPGGVNGQPALLLLPAASEPEAVVSVSTTAFRWRALDGVDEVWVAGNPTSRFAVAAPAGPGDLIIVKRAWLRWWAKRLERIAKAD
jgi:hypothetical protein